MLFIIKKINLAAYFVNLLLFIGLFILSLFIFGCGFKLAKNIEWRAEADTIKIAKIDNLSKTLGLEFELKKYLLAKASQHSLNFSKHLADLEVAITLVDLNISVQQKEQKDKNYYLQQVSLKAELSLKDFRNLSPANKNIVFFATASQESQQEQIDEFTKMLLIKQTVDKLGERIFTFLTY